MFDVHMLNEKGKKNANLIKEIFEEALSQLESVCGPDRSTGAGQMTQDDSGREMAIMRTKLEEASFFAKKAMAKRPENQENQE